MLTIEQECVWNPQILPMRDLWHTPGHDPPRGFDEEMNAMECKRPDGTSIAKVS